jgi:hypothetical protein
MSKSMNVPAYLALVMKVLEIAEAEGLTVERDVDSLSTLPENKQFCFVFVDGGDAALIIPKHAGRVRWCDSHIDWAGREGYVPHPTGDNGTVICRIDPAKVDLTAFLHGLSGASRRDKKTGSRAASQADLEALKAKLQSLGLPKVAATPSATDGVTVRRPADDLELDGEFVES